MKKIYGLESKLACVKHGMMSSPTDQALCITSAVNKSQEYPDYFKLTGKVGVLVFWSVLSRICVPSRTLKAFHYVILRTRHNVNYFFSPNKEDVLYSRRRLKIIKIKGVYGKLCFFCWIGLMNER